MINPSLQVSNYSVKLSGFTLQEYICRLGVNVNCLIMHTLLETLVCYQVQESTYNLPAINCNTKLLSKQKIKEPQSQILQPLWLDSMIYWITVYCCKNRTAPSTFWTGVAMLTTLVDRAYQPTGNEQSSVIIRRIMINAYLWQCNGSQQVWLVTEEELWMKLDRSREMIWNQAFKYDIITMNWLEPDHRSYADTFEE